MKRNQEERVRKLCMSLADTSEKLSHGAPSFFVRGKMFAMFVDNHHGDERVAVWLQAAPGVQQILTGADPKRFFVPPYVGPSGWIGVRVDLEPDWDEVGAHIAEAHREAAEGARARRPPRPRASAPKRRTAEQ